MRSLVVPRVHLACMTTLALLPCAFSREGLRSTTKKQLRSPLMFFAGVHLSHDDGEHIYPGMDG